MKFKLPKEDYSPLSAFLFRNLEVALDIGVKLFVASLGAAEAFEGLFVEVLASGLLRVSSF